MLTQSQKDRIAIAKDVLKHIKSLNVQRGSFLKGKLPNDLSKNSGLQKHIGKLKYCQVCAVGACIVSKARLFDGLPLRNLNYYGDSYDGNNIYVENNDAYDILGKFFRSEQLALIENTFECGNNGWVDDCEEAARSRKFGERYKTDRGRLKGIMQNIIKNKGDFVP